MRSPRPPRQRHSDAELRRVVDGLKGLGVQKVGSTHSFGDKAIAKLKLAFGSGFIRMGVGQMIEVGE
jgi:metal-dependent hydrolase (beta-lactamase superfamily II)